MGKINRLLGFASCLLICANLYAQSPDPASPKAGNAQRGRVLLSILGPKPKDEAGISPLQQSELNRRVRCAATRQEIQDELDFEAAGSSGFYKLPQLRELELETCSPVGQDPLLAQMAQQSAPPTPTYRVPANLPPAPTPRTPPPARTVAAPVQPVAPVVHAPQPPPARPAPVAASGPAFTPAPNYPDAEKAAGHEGSVLLELVMNADGSVKSATVAQSCNFPVLDASALAAARTWRIPAAAGRTIKVPLKFSAN